jgi:hypothetical protein
MSDESEPGRVISDEEFGRQLFLLRRTRRFLIEEGVPATVAVSSPAPVAKEGIPATPAEVESPFSLGPLNLIRYRPPGFHWRRATTPTLADWQLLEEKQNGLQRFFNTELQHRFRLQATQRIITITPLLLLVVSFGALITAVFPPDLALPGGTLVVSAAAWRFASYLAWTSCLGGLGAIGFLAVNSLAIQDDATFDISNQSLVGMRIVLGALFGCIVSLPFCFPYFKDFTDWVIKGGDLAGGRGVLLLVPFLLGFSTTLVMAVLNRMIAGIESMFGIERSVPKRAPDTADVRTTPDARADQAPAPTSRGGDVHPLEGRPGRHDSRVHLTTQE